jgi:pectate lyase
MGIGILISLLFFALISFAIPAPLSTQLTQSFSLVGYAKAAPAGFGETTGGQGGKIFNVTNDNELQTAIKVIHDLFDFPFL